MNVHLFTSNSNERMRLRDWGRVWLLSLLTAGIFLGSGEVFWRTRGFQPTIQDDWGVWAKARRKAVNQGERAIILIGASRIQAGVHPDIFEEATGKRPLVLAIDGSNPIPVLKNLSEDERITGTIICSFIPMFLGEDSDDFGRANRWIREYNEQRWSSRLETRLSILIERNFVFGIRVCSRINSGRIFRKVEATYPLYAPMRPDRYRAMDFSMTDVDRIRRGRIRREKEFQEKAAPLSDERFMEKVARIDQMVQKIENRGGRVIFIRLPSTGVVRRIEDQTWPREKYWDILAVNTQANAVHFEDYPSLSKFDCPDGSHLDVRDARIFTRSLAEILLEQKLIRR
jgi:hypothetical protein